MKTFSSVLLNENKVKKEINKNVISLIDLDEDAKSKLENLEGYKINECCGCCCCGDAKCCEPSCGCSDNPSYNQIVYFYSEHEIVERLKTVIKVTDILNINKQFNQFKYVNKVGEIEPLYFKEWMNVEIMQQLPSGFNHLNNNEKLYNFIKELCEAHKLQYPICLQRIDNKIQLYFVKFTGSNGKEGSIKTSLTGVAKTLSELEKHDEIDWAQVLDVSIDNADDVYSFVITVTCEPDKFPYEINTLN